MHITLDCTTVRLLTLFFTTFYNQLTSQRLFDVTFSCARGECRCDDAKERIEKNEIPCDKAITQCPEDCTICDFCMEQLGCL